MAENKEENKEKQEKKATPYFDNYKRRYEAHLTKKREEREKQQKLPEGILQKAGEEIKQVEQKVLTEEQKILEEVGKKLYGVEKEIVKETKDIEKKLEKDFKLNKTYIVLGTLILIILIFAGIYFFTLPTIKTKYLPLDVIISNSSGIPSTIYYNQKSLMSFSGWESYLNYNNKQDRLFGNEQYKKVVFDEKGKAYTTIMLDNEIRLEPLSTNPNQATIIGWFTNLNNIKISEETSRNEKNVIAEIKDNKGINSAQLTYNLFKGKPYFKAQFSASTENSSKLGNFAYGLIISGYDIYLENGTILKNDNQITSLNKTVDTVLYQGSNKTTNISSTLKNEISKTADTSRQALKRTGSSYKISNSDYEIFYNQNKSQAIIIYSPESLYYQNLFMWNVYQVYVPYNEGYAPLYVFVLDNVNLTYDETIGDWKIQTEDVSDYADFYINKIVQEIE